MGFLQNFKYDVIKNQLWSLDDENQIRTFDPKLVSKFSLFDSKQNKKALQNLALVFYFLFIETCS